MAILLDTQILIWDYLTPKKLSQPAQKAIDMARKAQEIIIADISLWEIAMVVEKKRIETVLDSETLINSIIALNDARVVPISSQIATKSVQLPRSINKDPSDRLIVATALVENVPLVTADHNLITSNAIQTIW